MRETVPSDKCAQRRLRSASACPAIRSGHYLLINTFYSSQWFEDPGQIKRIRKVFWAFVVRISDNEHILVTMHLQ